MTSHCADCGKEHTERPLSLTFAAPSQWTDTKSNVDELTSDFCVVGGKYFFVRACLEIPVIGHEIFIWGIWVSLSKEHAKRYAEIFGTDAEKQEPAYFGWFCNELPGYPPTIGLMTSVILQGGGVRPKIILDHSNPHPLCHDQHHGISIERAEELLRESQVR